MRDAENVVGGKKATKRSTHLAAEPIMVKQATTFGPTEVSANSEATTTCAPENGAVTD